jgi:hypothetical protein
MPLAVIIAGTTAIILILIAKFRIDFSNETRVLCRVFLFARKDLAAVRVFQRGC